MRNRTERLLVAIVSAGFVALGFILRDRVPWYATAFFGLCLVVALLPERWLKGRIPADDQHLAIDDVGVTRTARKLREHIAWADIVRVRIMTNDKGPTTEDVFFLLDGKDGGGCLVPHDLATRGGLLDALQARLEGVDNAAIVAAMLSVENRSFTIWERKSEERGGT
jgi:hypothetical protein